MRGRGKERVEAAVDHVAAAVLGAAVAYAVYRLVGARVQPQQLAAATAIGATLAYVLTATALRNVQAQRPRFEVPVFRMADLELVEDEELLLTEQVELVLTDADRLRPAHLPTAEELLLDDILAELGPQSRVVRLFDPAAMPTPGQLKSRIEQHLHGGTPGSPSPDASKALYDALAELRRSLR
jgi:hypothetical protein